MRNFEEVPRLTSPSLEKLYERVEEIRCDEIMAAERLKKKKIGVKVAMTRLRVKLSQVMHLCKQARKEILVMRDGKKEDGMEKYGVEEEEKSDKQASSGEVCPVCGKTVERHGNVRKCVDCGTEPFELKE